MGTHLWFALKSGKPQRKGEAFVKRGDTFAIKIYKDSVPDTFAFAQYLAKQLNRLEAVKAAKELEENT